MGATDEDTFRSLAGRLARLNKEVSPEEKDKFKEISNGVSLNSTVHKILDSYNPDKIEDRAKNKFKTENPTDEQLKTAQEDLIEEARKVFNGETE